MKGAGKYNRRKYYTEAIEVISTNVNDDRLKKSLARLNELLNLSRKHLIDGDYEEYFAATKRAFHAAHDLHKDEIMKKYSELFMTFIKDSLAETRTELRIMSSGIFGKKKYRKFLQQANLLIGEFENYRIAASDLDSFNITQYNHNKEGDDLKK